MTDPNRPTQNEVGFVLALSVMTGHKTQFPGEMEGAVCRVLRTYHLARRESGRSCEVGSIRALEAVTGHESGFEEEPRARVREILEDYHQSRRKEAKAIAAREKYRRKKAIGSKAG